MTIVSFNFNLYVSLVFVSVLDGCQQVYADRQSRLPDSLARTLERVPAVAGSHAARVSKGQLGGTGGTPGKVTGQHYNIFGPNKNISNSDDDADDDDDDVINDDDDDDGDGDDADDDDVNNDDDDDDCD